MATPSELNRRLDDNQEQAQSWPQEVPDSEMHKLKTPGLPSVVEQCAEEDPPRGPKQPGVRGHARGREPACMMLSDFCHCQLVLQHGTSLGQAAPHQAKTVVSH